MFGHDDFRFWAEIHLKINNIIKYQCKIILSLKMKKIVINFLT